MILSGPEAQTGSDRFEIVSGQSVGINVHYKAAASV